MFGRWSAAIVLVLFAACSLGKNHPRCLALLPEKAIAVYGDSQRNHRVHRKVVSAICALRPAMVFHAGDLVDNGHKPSDWKKFNRITGELRSQAPFYPAPGNHEGNSPLYSANFNLPDNERWYAVNAGPAEFFVLDGETSLAPASMQCAWFENRLANSDVTFKIVILHPALFSSSDDGGNEELRGYLCPLFERYGVSVVFSGHHHNYERSRVNGVYYIVTGGGGGGLDPKSRHNPYSQVFSKKHHFCAVSFKGETLSVTVCDFHLKVIDHFEVEGRNER